METPICVDVFETFLEIPLQAGKILRSSAEKLLSSSLKGVPAQLSTFQVQSIAGRSCGGAGCGRAGGGHPPAAPASSMSSFFQYTPKGHGSQQTPPSSLSTSELTFLVDFFKDRQNPTVFVPEKLHFDHLSHLATENSGSGRPGSDPI